MFHDSLVYKAIDGETDTGIFTRAHMFDYLSVKIMLYKLTFYACISRTRIDVFTFQLLRKCLNEINRNRSVYPHARSHVLIDQYELREYCFNANIRV